jgi:hypothetical protein
LSSIQMESHGADIALRNLVVFLVETMFSDGWYQIPLDTNIGLGYRRCMKAAKDELEPLPEIIMTADVNWHPSKNDNKINDLEIFYDANDYDILHGPFDQYGECLYHTIAIHNARCQPEFFDPVEFIAFGDMVYDLPDVWQPGKVCDIYFAKMFHGVLCLVGSCPMQIS